MYFGPTYTATMGGGISAGDDGKICRWTGAGIWPCLTLIPAALKARSTSTERLLASGEAKFAAIQSPYLVSSRYKLAANPTFHSWCLNTAAKSSARFLASVSPMTYANCTVAGGIFSSASPNAFSVGMSNCRQDVLSFINSVSRWALSARSLEISCIFRDLTNPIRLNITSPATPAVTKKFAPTGPQCSHGVPYGWFAHAKTISNPTPRTTNAPHPHVQRSQDNSALSSSGKSRSLAFLTPFRRYHPKSGNGFVGFWVGLGIGATLLAFLSAAIHFGLLK